MHGQSEYTPTKQRHFQGILDMATWAWNPLHNGKRTWAHPEVIAIDCTSGTGHTESGEAGSPLIINRWASQNFGDNYRQLCCEQQPSSLSRLSVNDLPGADLRVGRYQEIVPEWLEDLDIRRPALGFIYVDPNGAKDLLEGIELFRQLSCDPRFNRIDLIFHWSLTAYKKNKHHDWAQSPLLEIVEQLASLKPYAFMREPLEKWQWVFMYLVNTAKLNGTWKRERIMAYQDWLEGYSNKVANAQMHLGMEISHE